MNIKRLLPIIITAVVLMLSGCGKEVGENNSMQISEVIPNSNIEELEVGLSREITALMNSCSKAVQIRTVE